MGGNIVTGLIGLLLIGFLGIISITVYSDLDDSLTATLASSTSDAAYTMGNFSENFYDAEDLASNIPVVLAAGLLLAVLVGLAFYVRA